MDKNGKQDRLFDLKEDREHETHTTTWDLERNTAKLSSLVVLKKRTDRIEELKTKFFG